MWVLMCWANNQWVSTGMAFTDPNVFLIKFGQPTNVDPGVMQWDKEFLIRDESTYKTWINNRWCIEHKNASLKGVSVDCNISIWTKV